MYINRNHTIDLVVGFCVLFQCDRNLFWSYIWYRPKNYLCCIFQVAPKMVSFCRNWSVWSGVCECDGECVCQYTLFFPAFELHVKRFYSNWINKHALQHTSNELKFMFYIGCGFGFWFVLFWLLLHKCRWKEAIILAENIEWMSENDCDCCKCSEQRPKSVFNGTP